MAFTIVTKNSEKTFNDKELVNISSKEGYDYLADFGFNYMLTVKYDEKTNKCTVLNQFHCDKILFKGDPLPDTLDVDKTCRLLIKDSDDFIQIKLNAQPVKVKPESNNVKLEAEKFTEADVADVYGNKVNASAKLKLEKRKSEIEAARVAITKQVYYHINDLTRKLSMNSKAGIVLHIALLLVSVILAFGCANYFAGLELKQTENIIHMPINVKIILVFSALIYAAGLVLKQGVFLYFQNKINSLSVTNKIGEKLMLGFSTILFCGIYLINLLYYLTPESMPFFAVFMSLFFTVIGATLAVACGYYKNNNVEISKELNKYEYREDFEAVVREYRHWIEMYINSLTNSKINNIKDTLFNLQLKSAGEILLGVLTAPFLAYGVSNTLAMCFPEAAGWIRISSLKFSPVFLTLASLMIIFAFFMFVNGFLCSKKIQASNVIKNDGFSNYLQHGVEIYGLQGIKRIDTDMRRSFIIGLCVILIEFTMNISYFMQEMGSEISGMLLSFLGALVPTALLIAETYMLSKLKFEIESGNELLAKIER